MARKKRQEEHENLERWLVSYADFITLLFAFFVVMYAISQVDQKKLGNLMEALAIAFKKVEEPIPELKRPLIFEKNKAIVAQPVFISAPVIPPKDKEEFRRIRERLEALLAEGKFKRSLKILQDGRGLTIRLEDTFFFDSGSAAIRSEALDLLGHVGSILAPSPNQIRIEGHTDDRPIKTARFASNWELSTARATSIIQYLLSHHPLAPDRLSAAGYGEYRPIADNRTAEGRAQNRRVDIVVLAGHEGKQEPAAPAGRGESQAALP